MFYAGAMNAMMPGWLAWYRLAQKGHHTQALVTRREPESHQRCFFEFTVGTQKYEASDDGCHTQVGDRFLITYAPTDPSFATARDPAGELATQILGALGMSCVAGLLVAWQLRRKQSDNSAVTGRPTKR